MICSRQSLKRLCRLVSFAAVVIHSISCGDQAFESASLWSRQHGSPAAVFVSLKAANEKLALVNHLRRQMVMQRDEQFLMTHHLSTPLRAIHRFEMGEVLLLEVQASPVDVTVF